MELEELAKRCQHCAQNNPVIVLGSGASIPHGIQGMNQLAEWLQKEICAESENEIEAWQSIKKALEVGRALEAVLDEYGPLPDSLISKIVDSTWNFITRDDHALFLRAASGNEVFPLSRLLGGLFRSTNREINVITTNYDRVIEYASDIGRFVHKCGFLPGYVKRLYGSGNFTFQLGNQKAKTVTIWKVHGSIDWFVDPLGDVISLPSAYTLPEGFVPLIVTPGVSKFERTHDEPFRSTIQGADKVLDNSTAVICIGYGFRDRHIHPKLIARCRTNNTPILIAARTLTQEAREFLRNSGGDKHVALEDHDEGTMVYTSDYPDGVVVVGGKYWEMSQLNETIGY